MLDPPSQKFFLLTKVTWGSGPVAQWITRLTTDQKILGSTPGWLVLFQAMAFKIKSFIALVRDHGHRVMLM